MDRPLEHIAANVQAQRRKKNLTQDQLASLAKINVKTLWRLEQKSGSPSWTTVQLLADALDVDPFDLARPSTEKKK